MTGYELLLFVHVLAAAAWFGGALMSWLLFELALQADDPAWTLRLMEHEDRLATRLYIPASLLTLVAGITLVVSGGYDFGDGFVIAGLVLFIWLFAMGMAVFAPAGARVRAAAEEHGVDSEAVRQCLRRVRAVSRFDTPLLALAILLMVTKPF